MLLTGTVQLNGRAHKVEVTLPDATPAKMSGRARRMEQITLGRETYNVSSQNSKEIQGFRRFSRNGRDVDQNVAIFTEASISDGKIEAKALADVLGLQNLGEINTFPRANAFIVRFDLVTGEAVGNFLELKPESKELALVGAC